MSYYRAEIDDFYVGKVYEQRAGDIGKWRTAVLQEEHLMPQAGGHYHFMEVLVNLQLFKNKAPYYKMKHLDEEDILSFGFLEKIDDNFEDPNDYLAFEHGNFTLLFYPASKRVDIYEDIKGALDRLFTGQVLDFNELKTLLKQVGILYDEKRKSKFKERV
jgi:hypothetical protein